MATGASTNHWGLPFFLCDGQAESRHRNVTENLTRTQTDGPTPTHKSRPACLKSCSTSWAKGKTHRLLGTGQQRPPPETPGLLDAFPHQRPSDSAPMSQQTQESVTIGLPLQRPTPGACPAGGQLGEGTLLPPSNSCQNHSVRACCSSPCFAIGVEGTDHGGEHHRRERKAVHHHLQTSRKHVRRNQIQTTEHDIGGDPAASLATDPGCDTLQSKPPPSPCTKLRGGGHWNRVGSHTGNCARKGGGDDEDDARGGLRISAAPSG